MKLVRFGEKGAEKAGVMDKHGILRDVSGRVTDWDGNTLNEAHFAQVREHGLERFPRVAEGIRLGAPVGRVGKIVGLALTYGKHAQEAGLEAPKTPMFMLIARNAINGPYDDVMIPRGGRELDWEVELGVVMGKGGSYISVQDAPAHIAGYCVANDISERQFQLERGTQWTKGKSAPTLKPLGPWLVSCDEIAHPEDLSISIQINGVTRQSSRTSDMLFSIAEMVAYISNYLEWEAGDVMLTGTPPGVGYGMNPPLYLKPGDIMEPTIEGLGLQRSRVVGFHD